MPNESLIHADIFFFISTVALVLISIAIVVASVYVIKILRNVKEVTDKMNAESSEIISDLKKLRANLRDEGVKWKHVADLARNFFVRKGKSARKAADAIIK
ncbi:MAG: hypothetical protein HZA81_02295 [Candidatus Taylorbacteria bacterium]|nr:hypothetical protein [Candidatus Taylorbacteria bacterium]